MARLTDMERFGVTQRVFLNGQLVTDQTVLSGLTD